MASVISSCADILKMAQSMHANGIEQYVIIDFIYKFAAHYGIKVRHDQQDIAAAPAQAALVVRTSGAVRPAPVKKSKKKILPIAFDRQPDGTHKLVFGDDAPQSAPTPGSMICRIALSSDKRMQGPAQGSPFVCDYECNGYVIDARNWRPLSIPPGAFNLQPDSGAVDGFLAENLYDIINVDDGTVVTIYCWDHPTNGQTWSLATSNGYDVSTLYWMGALTYAEVLHDLINRVYPDFITATGMTIANSRINFTNLDRTYCYTIGFRHHNFHPVTADPERIWQIQSVCTVGEPVINYDGLLPVLPKQSLLPLNGLTLGHLRTLNARAATRKFHYGYILRSRHRSQTKQFSDILLESQLLTKVRRIIYAPPPFAIQDDITAVDRIKFVAMRAFLTPSFKARFLELCPTWAPQFVLYEEFVNNIVRLIIHTLRQRAMASTNREPALNSITGQIARALIIHINNCEKVSPFHKDIISIIKDYVITPEYAFLYMRALSM